jgi:lysine 2,3-aminomutase
VVLRNYEGITCIYNEPIDRATNCPPNCHYCDENLSQGERWAPEIGVGKLFNENVDTIALLPEGLERESRRDHKE